MLPALITEASRRNLGAIRELEDEVRRARTRVDRAIDTAARFAGSPGFLLALLAAVAGWVATNAGLVPGLAPFDPYPFEFLNFAVGVGAVLLSAAVLMTQNRQAREAEHWAHLALQIGLLAEQETTKMLEMQRAICSHLGLPGAGRDRELAEMIRTTRVEVLAGELKKSREADDDPPGPGPGDPPDRAAGSPSRFPRGEPAAETTAPAAGPAYSGVPPTREPRGPHP